MDSEATVLFWFRQDLRITDNLALAGAFRFARENQCRLKALYLSTPAQWRQHDTAPIQIDFIERNLNELSRSLAEFGVKLEHHETPTFKDQITFLKDLCNRRNIVRIFAGKEPEWNERQRDSRLLAAGLPIEFSDEHCIVPPGSVRNQQGLMFKVFTPFKKRWREIVSEHNLRKTHSVDKLSAPVSNDKIEFSAGKKNSSAWPAGEKAARQLLKNFCEENLAFYKLQRDFPALNATSQLSPYLAIGALSPRQCLRVVLHHFPQAIAEDSTPAETWLSELVWREFYRHLIVAFPKLCKYQNFKSNADQINWRNNPDEFKLWCQGQTGYPIVDAAMRQLNQTGWMHNRLRMITASFLSKHLLIDWRWGEKYFRQNLIDGDLAANNGGWQWSAGTGCDAQPYFRIFNPMEQSKKFDEAGEFIHHFIPELNGIEASKLHQANLINDSAKLFGSHTISEHYAPAIVEHKSARERALIELKAISNCR